MRAKLILAAVFLLAMPLLGGCWGATETDEVAYVLAMGFDKGQKKELLVTFKVANPRAVAGQVGGGGGGGSEIAFTSSVEALAPVSALDLMNSATTRRLSLQHTKVYIFSEEIAREGIVKWLAPLKRLADFRETADIYIVKGKAYDFLEKNKPLLEISPSKQYELLSRVYNSNSFFLPMQFKDFYEQVKSRSIQSALPLAAIHEGAFGTATLSPLKGGNYETGPYMAGEVPIKGENRAQFMGMAVFRGDKMVGQINGTDTRAYLLLRGKFQAATVNLPDPIEGKENFIGISMRQGRPPEYRTSLLEDGTVAIDVDIFIEGEIAAIASGVNYEDPNRKSMLEEALNQAVKSSVNRTVRQCQEEFNSDIFGFGKYVKRHFLTQREWNEFNWSERFPYARISVNVHTVIRRTGLMLKTSPGTQP